MPLEGSLPLKNSLTSCWTLGIPVEPPTSTISSMSFLLRSASSNTFWTGFRVPLNRSMFNSSNLALVNVSEKSSPSNRDSTSTNLVSSRKSPLSLLDLSSQLLDSTNILAEILSLLFLVQLDEMLHNSLVKVLSSKMSVSIGGHNLEDSVVDGEQ